MVRLAHGQEVKVREAKGGIVWMATQEVPPAIVIDQIEGGAGRRGGASVQVAADTGAGHCFLQSFARGVNADLPDKTYFGSQARRGGGAVGPAAADGLMDCRDRSFAILKQVCPRAQRRRLEVPIDVPHDAEFRGLKNCFVQHLRFPQTVARAAFARRLPRFSAPVRFPPPATAGESSPAPRSARSTQ